jgi:hypothetical protein
LSDSDTQHNKQSILGFIAFNPAYGPHGMSEMPSASQNWMQKAQIFAVRANGIVC